MKSMVFSIFDTKAGIYASPFFMLNQAMAMRGFADMAKSPDANVSKHPEDYVLYKIGEYDDETAELKATLPPENLGHASMFANVNGQRITDLKEV